MPLTIKRKEPRKNLVYTIAFDAPNSESYRFLGKMLASSLLRTFFTGDIMVFRNSPAPLFLVERKGLEEVYLETPPLHGQERAEWAWGWKYKVAELIDPEPYDKVLFLDCDSLALRNIDHLLEGTWDIRYQPERGKAMSGEQKRRCQGPREPSIQRCRAATTFFLCTRRGRRWPGRLRGCLTTR
jgi:hypothetical protein